MKSQQIFLLLFLIFFGACQKEEPITEISGHKLHISVTPVERKDMVDSLQIFGKIKLRHEAFIASQFDGRLTDFSLLMGDNVKSGQQIGVIIPPAREALTQVLGKIDASVQPLIEQQIKSIPLYSPINGTVLEVLHHRGDVVQQSDPILYIGDLSQLDVYGELPVKYLPSVKDVKHIRVDFINYPHPSMELPVEAISGTVNDEKQTATLRLGLANATGEFKPGMMVRLNIQENSHKNVIAMPRAALLEEEGNYHTFVLNGEKVEIRPLKVGIIHDDFVEILSGLSDGDQVAIEHTYSLVDGMEVMVK